MMMHLLTILILSTISSRTYLKPEVLFVFFIPKVIGIKNDLPFLYINRMCETRTFSTKK